MTRIAGSACRSLTVRSACGVATTCLPKRDKRSRNFYDLFSRGEKPMSSEVAEFVESRGIKSLYHFTRIANLDSILTKGLLTRDQCEAMEEVVHINDEFRYDGTNAVCATISFPNYKMFYSLRCNNPDAEWVVLQLKRTLLSQSNCAFCATNAASSSVTGIQLPQRQGVAALARLFDDFEGKSRSSLSIPPHYPTNPQAEVLLLDGANVGDIKRVYFQKRATMIAYQAKYPDIPCALDGGFFSWRSDQAHWKQ
jgi:ssDNA thymidine ADP-ribosyltransferase, DarT